MSDLISRADAIEAVANMLYEEPPYLNTEVKCYKYAEKLISALPSAETEPTVIGSKTLLPTKDFKEWAKRIREVNPNAIVIPCDAEVVSAEAEWIPITISEPNTTDHILVTYWWGDDDYEVSEMDYWITKYEAENGNASCKRLIDHVIAWRPMLKPYREESEVEE